MVLVLLLMVLLRIKGCMFYDFSLLYLHNPFLKEETIIMEKMTRRVKKTRMKSMNNKEKLTEIYGQKDPVLDKIIDKQNYIELPGTDEERKLLNDINKIYYSVKLISNYCCEKYKDSYVVARSAIYKLLYNNYKLEYNPSKILTFEFMPSKIDFKTQYVNLFGKSKRDSADNVMVYFSSKVEKPSKSVTDHVSLFLKKSKDDNLFLSSKKYKNTFKYCVRYIDSVNLFLYFIYHDGRTFTSEERCRLPNFDPIYSCSMESLGIVFEKISMFFSRIPNNNDDWIFYICELFQIDSFFKAFKINRMADRYIEFMSDENLEKIFKAFNFSYSEAKRFDSIIIDKIFKNCDFIEYCLQCEYLDPFYIFKLNLFHEINVHERSKDAKNWYNTLLSEGEKIKCDSDYNHDFSEIIDKAIEKTIRCIAFIEEDAQSNNDYIFCECKEIDVTLFNIQDIIKSDYFIHYYKDFLNNVFINKQKDNNETNLDFINYFDYLCNVIRKLLPGPIFPKKRK